MFPSLLSPMLRRLILGGALGGSPGISPFPSHIFNRSPRVLREPPAKGTLVWAGCTPADRERSVTSVFTLGRQKQPYLQCHPSLRSLSIRPPTAPTSWRQHPTPTRLLQLIFPFPLSYFFSLISNTFSSSFPLPKHRCKCLDLPEDS